MSQLAQFASYNKAYIFRPLKPENTIEFQPDPTQLYCMSKYLSSLVITIVQYQLIILPYNKDTLFLQNNDYNCRKPNHEINQVDASL